MLRRQTPSRHSAATPPPPHICLERFLSVCIFLGPPLSSQQSPGGTYYNGWIYVQHLPLRSEVVPESYPRCSELPPEAWRGCSRAAGDQQEGTPRRYSSCMSSVLFIHPLQSVHRCWDPESGQGAALLRWKWKWQLARAFEKSCSLGLISAALFKESGASLCCMLGCAWQVDALNERSRVVACKSCKLLQMKRWPVCSNFHWLCRSFWGFLLGFNNPSSEWHRIINTTVCLLEGFTSLFFSLSTGFCKLHTVTCVLEFSTLT